MSNKLSLRLCLFTLMLFIFQSAWTQQLPPFDIAFGQSEVSTVYITMPADSALAMFVGGNSDDEYAAQFAYQSADTDTSGLDVNIRLRGNTSLNAFKKSFRINFDGIDYSQEWQDLEKMNLIGLQNDPSLLRSKLCHDAFRAAGVFSARTAYVRLYLNDQYMGLYQNQEHIDEEFCKLYFDQQGDGNLFKCTYPATLEYLGSNPELYKFANWGTRHYDLKTNNWRDNYNDLAQFIDVLNNTPLSELECELPLVFDIETYLKTMAIDVITGNWDNYIYNKNNFYLYHHQLSDQFVYLPYDLDNTLGIDWVNQDWTSRDPYEWNPNNENRPLFDRILEVPAYRQRYSNYLIKYGETILSDNLISFTANALQNIIATAALEDTFRPLDFGFDDNAFLTAITESWGGHVTDGIVPYLETRNEFLSFQTDVPTVDQTTIHWLNHVSITGEIASAIAIKAFVTLEPNETLSLEVSTDNIFFEPLIGFNDNAINGDYEAFDGIFTIQFDNNYASEQLYYRIALGDGSYYPCSPKMMWLTSPTTGIVINEIMTRNSTTIADDVGEFDDWVELYNPTSNDINLSNFFLTDNIYNPNKFPLPAVTLVAGNYIVIWLDDDTEQGQLHANFAMNSTDDRIWLNKIQTGELRIQDSFEPCIAPEDQSIERAVDGGEPIQVTASPTPGYSNITATIELTRPAIVAFPNPATDLITFSQIIDFATLYDIQGRQLNTIKNARSLNVFSLEIGQYFIHTAQGQIIPIEIMR